MKSVRFCLVLLTLSATVLVAADRPTRPLMGWSSWNTFGVDISEDIILGVARAMATNGLAAAGYTYVNIDDGFFNGHGPDGRLRFHPARFPNGLKPVADGIHALGLHAGIYSDAGADTCGSLHAHDTRGRGSGLYGHDASDCRLYFNELGFDFIKVDCCGGQTLHLDERQRYTEIAQAIQATGRNVRLNICRGVFPGTWVTEVGGSWRTTGDIRANWRSVKSIICENLYLSAYVSPGHYNDLDMLEVGHLKGRTRTTFGRSDAGLTPDEETTHFGMWCLLSSPLLIGCDVRKMPASSQALVTNPDLLAMNQNDLGLAGYVVQREGEAYTFVKDAERLYGPSRYAAFCNLSDEPHAFNVPFTAFDLGGKVDAYDLVARRGLGSYTRELALTVPPHATRFLRLTAEQRLQRTVYEAETAWLTDYQELRNATKVGTAFPREMSGAGNGVAVGYLGRRETNDLIWKNVHLMKGGEVMLEFRVLSLDTRAFDVQIDGGAKKHFEVQPTNGAFVSVPMKISLAAGDHTVRLSNAKGWMPDIDRLLLSCDSRNSQ